MSLVGCVYTEPVSRDLSDLELDEVGIRVARSNLTELVSRVRLLQQVKFLTNRDRRMAVLVPVEFYERAERMAAVLADHPDLLAQVDAES